MPSHRNNDVIFGKAGDDFVKFLRQTRKIERSHLKAAPSLRQAQRCKIYHLAERRGDTEGAQLQPKKETISAILDGEEEENTDDLPDDEPPSNDDRACDRGYLRTNTLRIFNLPAGGKAKVAWKRIARIDLDPKQLRKIIKGRKIIDKRVLSNRLKTLYVIVTSFSTKDAVKLYWRQRQDKVANESPNNGGLEKNSMKIAPGTPIAYIVRELVINPDNSITLPESSDTEDRIEDRWQPEQESSPSITVTPRRPIHPICSRETSENENPKTTEELTPTSITAETSRATYSARYQLDVTLDRTLTVIERSDDKCETKDTDPPEYDTSLSTTISPRRSYRSINENNQEERIMKDATGLLEETPIRRHRSTMTGNINRKLFESN
ncbi:uncharacterized protein LOC121420799 [Lytechinus variegatus]|uniref:uncharacterized protein LOC121420799 n=1 Tax=Lytechinus variegatus TaxID=7654 RepID=UPI001BB2B929|nr:uncharacterized protein LOC121420799 [Lytechinus variegatus]